MRRSSAFKYLFRLPVRTRQPFNRNNVDLPITVITLAESRTNCGPALTSGIRHMKPKPRFSSRYGYVAPLLLPPNLRSFGSVAFTAHDFRVLDAWLAEEGWPAEHMDAAMLEGYLVALLVWPIQLSPGAWLPAIWGIRGWKVAAKIATPRNL